MLCITNNKKMTENKQTQDVETLLGREKKSFEEKVMTMQSKVLSKKEIAFALGCVSPKGRVYSNKMRKYYFNDEILEELGITPEDYLSTKTFTVAQTKRIIIKHSLHCFVE